MSRAITNALRRGTWNQHVDDCGDGVRAAGVCLVVVQALLVHAQRNLVWRAPILLRLHRWTGARMLRSVD